MSEKAIDSGSDASEVRVLDAGAPAAGPVCRLALPHVVRLSVHGCWHPSAACGSGKAGQTGEMR
jgi:carotenoid cleavage dioxygenase-like enzyme